MKITPIILGIIMVMMTLKKSVSNKGIQHLKYLEGERLKVYLDSANIPTVGVGHKVLPKDNLNVGDSITSQQSIIFLRSDLSRAKTSINTMVNAPLNQSQYDALVSFVFNVGTNAFKNSTLLRKINDYDYQGALAEFPRWRYSTDAFTGEKKIDAILVRRRKFEQDLFNS